QRSAKYRHATAEDRPAEPVGQTGSERGPRAAATASSCAERTAIPARRPSAPPAGQDRVVVNTAAPTSSPRLTRSKASLASSSDEGSTTARTGILAASSRNSSASLRV